MSHPGHLPRLPPDAYRGRAWVHWTMGLHNRTKGWLDHSMHSAFREVLLHAGTRYQLHCPAYCLMPDHAHLLWMGISPESDQLLAARFLRRHWNAILQPRGHQLQSQAHDRVLRHHECRPDSFEDTVLYIRHNPRRAGLVGEWQDWPYGGAKVPGFPEMPVFPACEFWGRFWKIHNEMVERRYRDRGESKKRQGSQGGQSPLE